MKQTDCGIWALISVIAVVMQLQMKQKRGKTVKVERDYLRTGDGYMMIVLMTLGLLSVIQQVDGTPEQPMICHASHDERSKPALMLSLPTDVRCAEPTDQAQEITPLTLKLYTTASIVHQNAAWLCVERTTVTETFLYMFTEERLHVQTTTYKPVTTEECEEMITRREIKGEKLTDMDGVISTHKSIEPEYTWCCHCEYDHFNCSLVGNGRMIWNGPIEEECIFKEAATIEGTNHGEVWLSNEHDMALTFKDSAWQPEAVCPSSQPGLQLIKSDQGIFVENTAEIRGYNFTSTHCAISWGEDVRILTQFLEK